jgi:antibiotic biosynthesis monooxygenase (ABM) superfamily enzyme
MTSATAVTVFHPAPDAEGFDAWLSELQASARMADGFESTGASIHDDSNLEWAVAVTFQSEELLHRWLDSPDRMAVLRDGQSRGYWCRSTDLTLTEGAAPDGVGAFRHSVATGREGDFRSAQVRLAIAGSHFPGYQGTVALPPDAGGACLSLIRFRTGPQLAGWMRSGERSEALRGLRSSLTKDFSVVSSTTPFGTTVRFEDGRTLMTPNWKSAMILLLVLYPTVMILSRFFVPILDRVGAQPWLALWVSQIVSVSAMQWWLMPAVTRPFQRWLDPVDGAGLRISVAGATVVVALYAATLTLFASVRWLQFWDYMD